MLSYTRFLTFTFVKKIAPWLILVAGILAYFSIAIIGINSLNSDGVVAVTSISTFDKFFPFLFAVLMSVFGIIHVFKEGEDDGSELTIIAKPLSRTQIITSKFLLILALIILYQLVMFFAYITVAFMDDYATNAQRMDYANSLFVGGLIVQTIVTSVLILLAAVLSKVGTLIVGIIAAAAFPILSFSLAPTTGGQPFDIIGFENDRRLISFDGTDGQSYSQNTDDIYFEPKPNYDSNGDGKINDADSVFWNSVAGYEDSQAYGAIAYLDFWYQWGRFYDMFVPEGSSNSAVVQQWNRVTKEITADPLSSISVGPSSYAIMMMNSPYGNDGDIDPVLVNEYITDFNNWSASPVNKTAFESLSLFGRLQAIKEIQEGTITSTLDDAVLSAEFQRTSVSGHDVIVAYNMLENKSAFANAQKLCDDSVQVIFDRVTDGIGSVNMPTLNLVKVGSTYETLESKAWIPTYVVIIIWSILGVALIAGATYIYFRRDFK